MTHYQLQRIDSDLFDLRDEQEQAKDWEIIYIADSMDDLTERLIDLINDDEIDTVQSFYRVVDVEKLKVIMGVE